MKDVIKTEKASLLSICALGFVTVGTLYILQFDFTSLSEHVNVSIEVGEAQLP
jgi:hypothetical protein